MYRRNQGWRDLLFRLSRKPLILAMALVITISGTLGGSLAWLTAATDILTNIFTIGNIDIDLKEENVDGDSETENTYEMEIGGVIEKNPTVTVYKNSKDCWLYVKIVESENFSDFLYYEMDIVEPLAQGEDYKRGWYRLDGEPGVYFRAVDENETADQFFQVIKDDKVHVKTSVTKEMLDELGRTNNYPYMKIKAFAVQRDLDISEINDPVSAWKLIPDTEKNLLLASLSATINPTAAPTPTATQNYAARKLQQSEDAWVAFASPGGQ